VPEGTLDAVVATVAAGAGDGVWPGGPARERRMSSALRGDGRSDVTRSATNETPWPAARTATTVARSHPATNLTADPTARSLPNHP
jgi:hypothetical protein